MSNDTSVIAPMPAEKTQQKHNFFSFHVMSFVLLSLWQHITYVPTSMPHTGKLSSSTDIAAIVPLSTTDLPATEVILEMTWWVLLVRVVLFLVTVVLVVEVAAAAFGLTLSLLAVDVVGALGLGEPVDLSTSEASEELFGELVGDWLA